MKKKITKTKFKKLEKLCLDAITEKKCVFFDEVYAVTDCIPSEIKAAGLDESAVLKEALEINRAELKRELRLKWFESTNATLNAALYKLVCTESEKRSLSSSGATVKTPQGQEFSTQDEYLKSLREMGEEFKDNADRLDEI